MFSIRRRRTIILDERNMMTVLKVLDKISKASKFPFLMEMEFGNCGISNKTTWFITFTLSDKNWKSMIRRLNKMNHELVLNDDGQLYLI